MPIPHVVTRLNKHVFNKALVRLAGHGPFVELEHVGRRSGSVYHVPLMAFRDGGRVTIALTYGPDVDWLKNLRAAQRGRMHLRRSLVVLGAPRHVPTAEGLRRIPFGPRQILPLTGTTGFVELEVLSESPFTGW